MLTKPAIVTVIPGTPGRAARAATSVCIPVLPGGVGSEPPPGDSTGDGSYVPTPGTPILLEALDGFGGYTPSAGVAPAPAGYVCRLEPTYFTDLDDPSHTSVLYNVVCTQQ